MKAYLKFAASFWMRAFLTMGSFATAKRKPAANAKKGSAASAASVRLV